MNNPQAAPDTLREALETLLRVAFSDDMFLTHNSVPMEATPGVRRAIRQARAALAAPAVPAAIDVELTAGLRIHAECHGTDHQCEWDEALLAVEARLYADE